MSEETTGVATSDPTKGEIGILERRRIEAAIIAPLYEQMREEIGEEKAQAILERTIRAAAIAAAKGFAERTPGGTSLSTFRDLQALWTKDDALTIEVLVATDQQFDYNVHRCRYAEAYEEMGLGHIGHLLSCNRDSVFCQGYDPRIQLERTQTIMGGASHCDFRYRLVDETEGGTP
ncbi:L-2-amino-thiazoline-4-carboxylic acid hydrolase [Ancylobacter sp. WKF20]|uniref:L-2-amino-thiazoline-4-carboxylic acid hydrolase n=1 Tax=Ancylobacter sp. WKF20 TaxID=3039801 RepID=UPI00243462F0|nr:L-2-amino-thiazoline-4-carboxylic acid hydrolase [Ancylobacter sp. WKF20]WGD28317.1 L-2-amino-thiazoline-4-carboxylic acid hydrolase [Ancylobacter sp. WKF20]